MSVTLKGFDSALRLVSGLPKQIRFASAQALNETAKDIQQFTVGSLLPQKFTLRSKGAPWQRPGTKFGFNIKFANKESLTAVIGSQADWLKLQEEGGSKSVSGHRLAIPTKFWKAREELLTREKKPGALIRLAKKISGQERELRSKSEDKSLSARKRRGLVTRANTLKKKRQTLGAAGNLPFLVGARGMADGSKLHAGIYVRTGQARLPIKALFIFEPSAKIKPIFDFVQRGTALAGQKFQSHFVPALTKALLTAK